MYFFFVVYNYYWQHIYGTVEARIIWKNTCLIRLSLVHTTKRLSLFTIDKVSVGESQVGVGELGVVVGMPRSTDRSARWPDGLDDRRRCGAWRGVRAGGLVGCTRWHGTRAATPLATWANNRHCIIQLYLKTNKNWFSNEKLNKRIIIKLVNIKAYITIHLRVYICEGNNYKHSILKRHSA